MSPSVFSAKPSVLRCSRCGKFVDWAEARLQIVCDCRPHLDLPPVLTREASAEDRAVALALFRRDFGRAAPIRGACDAYPRAPACAQLLGLLFAT